MAILFPTSPSLNQTYVSGDKTFRWNGASWRSTTAIPIEATSSLFDVNTPPASPHAMDDEFNGASLNTDKWKTLAGGTPTGWSISQGCLTNTTTNGYPDLIFQNISDSTWTFRMAISIPLWFNNINQTLSFTAYRSSNQRSIDFGHWSNGSNSRFPAGNRFASNYSSWQGNSYTGGYGNDETLYGYHMNYWEFELTATHVVWKWSNSGHTNSYRTIYSEPLSTWLGGTPTKVGIWVAAIPVAMIDWFRRVA